MKSIVIISMVLVYGVIASAQDELLHRPTSPRPRGQRAMGALKPKPPRYHFSIVSTTLYLLIS